MDYTDDALAEVRGASNAQVVDDGTMRNVLHFITTSIRSRYLEGIADHYDQRRFRLMVGTLDAGGPLHAELAAKGISSFTLDCHARNRYPLGVMRLIRRIKQHRIQILQTHLIDASLVGVMAARLARVPLVILTRHHADAVLLLRKRLPAWVDRVSATLAHRIIAPSRAVTKILCELEGVPAGKVAVIPYGFDFARMAPRPGGGERIRDEFSLHGQTVIGVIARLDRLKGHEDFFQALKRIAVEIPNLRALLVGEGPERARLEQLARELKIESRVIFAGYRQDVPDLISAMDVLAHPSRSEAFPQVVVEALAIGKPVVTCRVGGVPEIVKDGETGLLVGPDDPAAFATALRELMRRPEQAKAMAERGRVDVVSRFSITQMCRAYESCYEEWWNDTGRQRARGTASA